MTKALALWSALLAGPLAWLCGLEASYALVQWTCVSRTKLVLWVVGFLAVAATVTGMVMAERARRRVDTASTPARTRADSTGFMAHASLAMGAFFVIALLAGALPVAMLNVCE